MGSRIPYPPFTGVRRTIGKGVLLLILRRAPASIPPKTDGLLLFPTPARPVARIMDPLPALRLPALLLDMNIVRVFCTSSFPVAGLLEEAAALAVEVEAVVGV